MQATPTKPAAGESAALTVREPGNINYLKAFFLDFRKSVVVLIKGLKPLWIFLGVYALCVGLGFLVKCPDPVVSWGWILGGAPAMIAIISSAISFTLGTIGTAIYILIQLLFQQIITIGKQNYEQRMIEEKNRQSEINR